MRNLLFGSYLPNDDGTHNRAVVSEVSSFDTLEKAVIKAINEHNDKVGFKDIELLPNRFVKKLLWFLLHFHIA